MKCFSADAATKLLRLVCTGCFVGVSGTRRDLDRTSITCADDDDDDDDETKRESRWRVW